MRRYKHGPHAVASMAIWVVFVVITLVEATFLKRSRTVAL
jgi:hypothetical protein